MTFALPKFRIELSGQTALVTGASSGLGVRSQRATAMPVELIDRLLDVNVWAPYILSCEVARCLITLKAPGRIVNISSSVAFDYGGDGADLYSISKAAVIRMTVALAVEWARLKIDVNAIAPGAFASEMMDGMI